MKWVSLQRLSYALSKIEARYALRSHSHAAATTDAAGFMSAADKVKLNGISSGANKYTHPSYTQRPSGLYKVTVDTYGHVSAAAARPSQILCKPPMWCRIEAPHRRFYI